MWTYLAIKHISASEFWLWRYLQLRLASDLYFVALVERAEDRHGAHVHVDSISWEAERGKLHRGKRQSEIWGAGGQDAHAAQWIPCERPC